MTSPAKRGRRRWLAAVLVAAFLPATTVGCFGRFELTRRIYRFNQRVDPDKWVQWAVFLAFSIVPVYPFAAMIDAIFANSLEFWTGTNPILAEAGAQRVVHGPRGEVAVATRRDDGSFDLAFHDAEGRVHAFRLVPGRDRLEARDLEGRLVASVIEVEGAPLVLPAMR